MLSIQVVFGAAIVLLILYVIKRYQFAELNLAPGPFRLPVLGTVIPFLFSGPTLPWRAMDRIAKKYGDVFSMSIGSTYIDIRNNIVSIGETVVLNSYEVMQELLQRDEWSLKADHDFLRVRAFGKELGLAFVKTPAIWQEMRKFSQRTLRDFGFGKRLSMQGVIEEELADTLKEIKTALDKNNGTLQIKDNFTLSIINILWSMMTGIRYSHDDPKLLALLELTFRGAKKSTFVNPLLAFPKLHSLVTNLGPFASDFFNELIVLIKSIIDERREKGDYLLEPQNYIDVFLRKIKETSKNPNSVYTEEQLIIMLEDFWLVGSMTTSATLSYAILFLVLNPDAQSKVQREIDEHVPRHSIPTVEDIEKMPYTQALILEIHRLACVVPVPIPRTTDNTITYKGYKVPPGAIIVSNHWAVMMDKSYWGDPEVFRPERFINDIGEFVPDRRVVHFGFGKRYCIGVTLVNSVVPIFVTTFLQKFKLSLVPGEKLPNMTPNVGLNLTPYPFNIRMTDRE